jgi:hypothetical protein
MPVSLLHGLALRLGRRAALIDDREGLALREAGCENHRARGCEGVAKEGHAGAPMRIEVARYCAANVMKRCSSASPLLSQKSK